MLDRARRASGDAGGNDVFLEVAGLVALGEVTQDLGQTGQRLCRRISLARGATFDLDVGALRGSITEK